MSDFDKWWEQRGKQTAHPLLGKAHARAAWNHLEDGVERLKYKADKWDNHIQALIREEIKEENHG